MLLSEVIKIFTPTRLSVRASSTISISWPGQELELFGCHSVSYLTQKLKIQNWWSFARTVKSKDGFFESSTVTVCFPVFPSSSSEANSSLRTIKHEELLVDACSVRGFFLFCYLLDVYRISYLLGVLVFSHEFYFFCSDIIQSVLMYNSLSSSNFSFPQKCLFSHFNFSCPIQLE